MIPYFHYVPYMDGDGIGHCVMISGHTVCGLFVTPIYTGEGNRWPRSDYMTPCTTCETRLTNLFQSPIVGKWSWTHP